MWDLCCFTANFLQHACSWYCTFLLLNQSVCAVRQLPVCLVCFFKRKKREHRLLWKETLKKELTFPRQKTFSTRHVPTIETETHQACPNNSDRNPPGMSQQWPTGFYFPHPISAWFHFVGYMRIPLSFECGPVQIKSKIAASINPQNYLLVLFKFGWRNQLDCSEFWDHWNKQAMSSSRNISRAETWNLLSLQLFWYR